NSRRILNQPQGMIRIVTEKT
ncbi:hypothetical protein D039_4003B, partial [Vibrio parahaemolyticus EKP-028]